MVSAMGSALSGLSAASLRVGVAASNIANLQSTTTLRNGQRINEPYVPQEVVQSSDENGGVRATTRDVTPASIPQFDPSNPLADANGQVQVPNASLEEQLTNLIVGGYDYRASLKVFKANDDLTKSLLDVIA